MRSTGIKLGAVLLTAVAVAGTGPAQITYDIFCVHYEGAKACSGRRTEFVWHLVLAYAGLVAAGGMLWFAFRGSRRAVLAFLVVALALYTVSFLFSDAAVHGWHNVQVYPDI